MIEVVFARSNIWMPRVIRADGDLRLRIVGGADALHDPRQFSIPVAADHVEVFRADLTRHLLLWSAITPLCYAAGIRGPLDEPAAVALLDPILLGPEQQVESLFGTIGWDKRQLIAHGADIREVERGSLFAALQNATETSDWERVRTYDRTGR